MKSSRFEVFYNRIYKLLDKEDSNNHEKYGEGANISYAVIKAAVYYLLNSGYASFSDCQDYTKRAIKSWKKDSNWDKEEKEYKEKYKNVL